MLSSISSMMATAQIMPLNNASPKNADLASEPSQRVSVTSLSSTQNASDLPSQKSVNALADTAKFSAKNSEKAKQDSQNNQTNPANSVNPTDDAQSQQEVEQVLSQLKARDTEVRAHEAAHLATAGQYASGGMSFTYQTGPDGKQYAIGGEVGIDASPIAGDAEATIQKAQQVMAAALAPAEPSGQDMNVAGQAQKMLADAQVELQAEADPSKQMSEMSQEGKVEGKIQGQSAGKVGNNSSQDSSENNNGQLGKGLNNLNNPLFSGEMAARGAFDLRVNLQADLVGGR